MVMDLSEKYKKLLPRKAAADSMTSTINNTAVFVGTTEALQDVIKNMRMKNVTNN